MGRGAKRSRARRAETPDLARRRWPWRARRTPKAASAFIDQGLCSKCGYDLDGLASWRDPEARCPECGVPMIRARLGSDLPAADPASLRSVARGIRLINLSIGVAILPPLLGLLSMIAIISIVDAATGSRPDDNGIVEAVAGVLFVVAPIAAFVLWVLGWRVTEGAFADRRLAGSAPGVRLALRISNYGSVAASLAIVVFTPLSGVVWARGLDVASIALVATLVFATAGLGLWLLRGLAARTEIRRVKSGLTQLLATSPLLAVGPVVLAYQHLFGGQPIDRWAGMLNCVAIVWVLSFVGFMGRLRTIVSSAVLAQQDGEGTPPRNPGLLTPPPQTAPPGASG
jgi:hypothetical protein